MSPETIVANRPDLTPEAGTTALVGAGTQVNFESTNGDDAVAQANLAAVRQRQQVAAFNAS